MVVTKKFIEENYPLHNLVWQNRGADLDALIENSPVPLDLEKLDPRGRSPLFLATSLGSYDTALVLLKHNANTSFEHSSGWTVVHEAVCSGNPELLGVILKYRDHQRRAKRSDLIPKLLQRLKDTPDFFFDMKWEFTSWIPLMTRMCPANTHRVYKMGSYLRVDSTDNGVEDPSTSSKGAISVIFQGREEGVKMMEIDHGSSQVYSSMILAGNDKSSIVPDVSVYEKSISQRLANPAIISFVNLEKIAFERNKTGIWGWGSDKSERISTYDCKVFAATNVELVTRMRYEHLTEADKTRSTSMSNLQKVLNTFGSEEVTETQGAAAAVPTKASASFPSTDLQVKSPVAAAAAAITPTTDVVDLYKNITAEEYFDADHDLQGADIGRPREIKTKINKFKATGWLCEEYPLNLQEQLMPIVELMALSSSQFSKLKDFMQMQMPAGFPIKIEIPLFHLVNACITFHNIFSTEEAVPGVSHLTEDSGRLSCILDEQLFEPPSHYTMRSASNFGPITSSSDDDIFQWTSTDETAETMDIYQALNAPRTLIKDISPESDAEEQLLQRAIEESLKAAHQLGQLNAGINAAAAIDDGDSRTRSDVMITRSDSMEQLQRVLDMSRQEIEDEARLRREEEEALRRVLELSLHDK